MKNAYFATIPACIFLMLGTASFDLRADIPRENETLTTHNAGPKHVIIAAPHIHAENVDHEPLLMIETSKDAVRAQEHAPLTQAAAPFMCKADGSLCQVFFSPHDGLREKLIQLIDAEQESINIAVFTFTDKEIAQALLRAYGRGVQLSLIVDPVCVRDRYNKVGMLCDHNICIFVYNAQHARAGMNSSMHHKFALFKKNMGNKPVLWTGSFNFTRSASMSNHENALVLNNPDIIAQFERQFEHIKNQSYRYKMSKKNHATA